METIITIKIEHDEKTKVKIEQTQANSVESYSQYARFFDESCPGWRNDAECNLMFLRFQERYANELLKGRGHLFLNDVYDMLGIPRSKAGQVVGWIYDEKNPVGDNRVDFGLTKKRRSDFVNGYAKNILLDFNVDGMILDRL